MLLISFQQLYSSKPANLTRKKQYDRQLVVLFDKMKKSKEQAF